MKRVLTAIALGLVAVVGLSACATAEPDKMGLYYMQGSIDGYHFGKCVQPGQVDGGIWNNELVQVPASLRTWNIAPEGDSTEPIIVSSKPETGQPSGVQVKVWPQITFNLNINCDNGDKSPVVQWWEQLGRRYDADTANGWRKMLVNSVVPVLTTSTGLEARKYNADGMVAGIGREEMQSNIAVHFSRELNRLSGGNFFCGPPFDPKGGECLPVQVLLTDIEYADPGIQLARNERQKALELAAAKVAAAEGDVKAAAARDSLLRNEAWVRLEIARMQQEACLKAVSCTIVTGTDNVLVGR